MYGKMSWTLPLFGASTTFIHRIQKLYVRYMFKSLSQFNYLRMPLVEQELLILLEKMSSRKVLMGFIMLDL